MSEEAPCRGKSGAGQTKGHSDTVLWFPSVSSATFTGKKQDSVRCFYHWDSDQ